VENSPAVKREMKLSATSATVSKSGLSPKMYCWAMGVPAKEKYPAAFLPTIWSSYSVPDLFRAARCFEAARRT
jgi:hypothetical protein